MSNNFKKYRNKKMGEIVEARFEEYSECGTFNWHGFVELKDEPGMLIPFPDFIKQYEELKNDK